MIIPQIKCFGENRKRKAYSNGHHLLNTHQTDKCLEFWSNIPQKQNKQYIQETLKKNRDNEEIKQKKLLNLKQAIFFTNPFIKSGNFCFTNICGRKFLMFNCYNFQYSLK